MSGPSERERVATAAAVVYDVALLVAVFYAPIFWGGFNTAGQVLVTGAIAVAAMAWLVALAAEGRGPAWMPSAVAAPAIALLVVSAVSTAFSASQHDSLIELSRLVVGVLVFWLVASRGAVRAAPVKSVAAGFGCSVVLVGFISMQGESGLSLKLLTALSVGLVCAVMLTETEQAEGTRWWRAALIATAGLVVALYGVREKLFVLKILGDPTWRIFSTFFNPNPLGGFFALVLPLAASAAIVGRRLWHRLLWVFAALLLAAAILPTYSKGAMLAALVSMSLYGVLLARASGRPRRNLGIVLGVFGALAVAVGMALLLSTPVRTRVIGTIGTQSHSNMFRLLTWQGTMRMAEANPWVGIGPGAFKHAFMNYAVGGYTEAAHQTYLQVAAEQGLVGGAIFLWLLGAVLLTAGRAVRRAKDFEGRALAIGGLCSVVALMVHGLLDYDWYIGAIGVTFWLVAGLLAHQAQAAAAPAVPAPAAPVEVEEPEPERKRKTRRRRERPAGGRSRRRSSVRIPASLAAVGISLVLVAIGSLWAPVRNALAQKALNAGDAALMQKDVGRTRERYEAAVSHDPGWALAWERYGLLLPEPEGEEAIRRAISLEPTSFRPWGSLARYYEYQGDFYGAVMAYGEAIERYPNHTGALRGLARVHERLGQYDEADAVYRRMVEVEQSPYNQYRAIAIDTDTEYAFAHYGLGRSALRRYQRGEYANGLGEALEEFNRTLVVIAEYVVRGKDVDDMFRMLGKPRAHREEELKTLAARARWRMAAIYEGVGEGARAEEERAAALSVYPEVEAMIAAEDGKGIQ